MPAERECKREIAGTVYQLSQNSCSTTLRPRGACTNQHSVCSGVYGLAGGFWPSELGPRGYSCAHGQLWALGGCTDLGRTLTGRGPQLRQLIWLYSPSYSSSNPWTCSRAKAGEREGGKEGGRTSPLLHPVVQTKSQTSPALGRDGLDLFDGRSCRPTV